MCQARQTDIRQQLLKARKTLDEKVQFENFTFDQDVSRNELANAIILHEYSLSIVDHYGFRKFIATLQPLFKMVSRNTIKSDVLKIYDVEKKKTYTLLEKLNSRIVITTEKWSCTKKKGIMAITAHFIDESWILHSRILRYEYCPLLNYF